nr:hypothetical protein Iba_chr09aCG9270 [Ipomoea batatas]
MLDLFLPKVASCARPQHLAVRFCLNASTPLLLPPPPDGRSLTRCLASATGLHGSASLSLLQMQRIWEGKGYGVSEEEELEISCHFWVLAHPMLQREDGSVAMLACSGITARFYIGSVRSSKLNELKVISKSISSWVKTSWVSAGTGM